MRRILVLLVSLTALAGCGLRGELERPVPLWGDPPNEGPNDPRTLKAQEEREAAEKAASAERQRAEDEAQRLELERQSTQPPAPPVDGNAPSPGASNSGSGANTAIVGDRPG